MLLTQQGSCKTNSSSFRKALMLLLCHRHSTWVCSVNCSLILSFIQRAFHSLHTEYFLILIEVFISHAKIISSHKMMTTYLKCALYIYYFYLNEKIYALINIQNYKFQAKEIWNLQLLHFATLNLYLITNPKLNTFIRRVS